jgi:hypothetical protein
MGPDGVLDVGDDRRFVAHGYDSMWLSSLSSLNPRLPIILVSPLKALNQHRSYGHRNGIGRRKILNRLLGQPMPSTVHDAERILTHREDKGINEVVVSVVDAHGYDYRRLLGKSSINIKAIGPLTNVTKVIATLAITRVKLGFTPLQCRIAILVIVVGLHQQLV